MDEALIADVVERLDADTELVPQTGELVLAALLGEDEVNACLGGTSPARPELDPTPAAPPCRAYVKALTVEGFRGIGPTSRVELSAGPGLTLVIGRNGSGKSSYAEALELLLTGDSQRWSSRRSKIWKDGWRNLHHQGPTTIEAEILIDGEPGSTSLHRSWTATDDLTGGNTRLLRGGETLASLAPLGWEEPLKTYRPFLSYNELGSMLEEGPSRLYDALGSIFGLEDLVDAAARLAAVRKERTAAHKAVKDKLVRLRRGLEQLEDERAERCLAALKGTKLRLDEVEALVTGDRPAGGPDSELDRLSNLAQLPDPDLEAVKTATTELRSAAAEVERVRATDANRARSLAGLLQRSLEFHDQEGDGDCPVCGRDGALDADWHRLTETAIGDLRTQADAADQAHRRCAAAEQRTRTLLAPPPQVLEHAAALGVDPSPVRAAWESWRATQEKAGTALATALEERAVELAAAVGKVRDEAQRKLDERQGAWRDVALDVAGWLPEARRMTSEKELVKQVKTAETWLNETATRIRNERFQPIKEQVKSYWELLRARSSVDIDDVTFGGRATRRRVNLDVTVDGTEGAALARRHEPGRAARSRSVPVFATGDSGLQSVSFPDDRRSGPGHGSGPGRRTGAGARNGSPRPPGRGLHPRRSAAGGGPSAGD